MGIKQIFSNSKIWKAIKKTKIYSFYAMPKRLNYAKDFLKSHQVSFVSDENKVSRDMLDSLDTYGVRFKEYFQFHFEGKTHEQRKQYVSDNERREKYTKQLNANPHLLDDKWLTYQKLKKYYKRDVCKYQSEADLETAKAFVNLHSRFILKPIASQKGQGIQIVDTEKKDFASIISMIKTEYPSGVLLEELIAQDTETAKFHPESVNTLRIATFNTKSGIICCFPCFRMGVGNAIVDNAGAGGIVAALNEDGTIMAVADELGHTYPKHPNTNISFSGYTIPKFNEAEELCMELAKIIPENKYCSWDLALSKGCWILVEGNANGHILWQIPSNEGIRNQLETIVKITL